MSISTYRYGSERGSGEGLRLGTARFLPRGIRRQDWQKKGYFDLWLPLLAPDADHIKAFLGGKITYAQFSRHYHSRMKRKECRQVIELLAGVSLFVPLSLGCYCEAESRCHRSLLKKLIAAEAKKRGKDFAKLKRAEDSVELLRFASPVCLADCDHED